MGLLGGQDVLTVDTMQAKGAGAVARPGRWLLPEPMVRPYLEAGRLVAKRVARPERQLRLHYAWGGPGFTAPGARCNGGCSSCKAPPRARPCWKTTTIFEPRQTGARVSGYRPVFNVERHFRCL